MPSITSLQQGMRTCRKCREAGYAVVPGAVFSGGSDAEVMIIGQAPGITELEAKRPFNAGSGRRLFEWLGRAGWEEYDFRRRHYMTSVTKCYPGKSQNGKGDRLPSKQEQAICRPFLEKEMALINPRLVIPVGGLAIRLFFPRMARLGDVIGTAAHVPAADLAFAGQSDPQPYSVSLILEGDLPSHGCWLVPLPHPSGASLWPNNPGNQALIAQAIEILAVIRVALRL